MVEHFSTWNDAPNCCSLRHPVRIGDGCTICNSKTVPSTSIAKIKQRVSLINVQITFEFVWVRKCAKVQCPMWTSDCFGAFPFHSFWLEWARNFASLTGISHWISSWRVGIFYMTLWNVGREKCVKEIERARVVGRWGVHNMKIWHHSKRKSPVAMAKSFSNQSTNYIRKWQVQVNSMRLDRMMWFNEFAKNPHIENDTLFLISSLDRMTTVHSFSVFHFNARLEQSKAFSCNGCAGLYAAVIFLFPVMFLCVCSSLHHISSKLMLTFHFCAADFFFHPLFNSPMRSNLISINVILHNLKRENN